MTREQQAKHLDFLGWAPKVTEKVRHVDYDVKNNWRRTRATVWLMMTAKSETFSGRAMRVERRSFWDTVRREVKL